MNEPLTDQELADLEWRYTAQPVPVCPVCGDKLDEVKSGGGEPSIWACNPWETDPNNPVMGKPRLKTGRSALLTSGTHSDRSRFVQRRTGDELVLRAVVELRRLRRREQDTLSKIMREARSEEPDMNGCYYCKICSRIEKYGHADWCLVKIVEGALTSPEKQETE